jgi:protoheme ferro-lyase
MRYWDPLTADVLEEMYADGINTMVIVPLYPQFSISTSGSSLRLLQELFNDQPERWSASGANQFLHTVVPAWYHRKGYVDSMASLILKELSEYSPEQRASQEGVHVLFRYYPPLQVHLAHTAYRTQHTAHSIRASWIEGRYVSRERVYPWPCVLCACGWWVE